MRGGKHKYLVILFLLILNISFVSAIICNPNLPNGCPAGNNIQGITGTYQILKDADLVMFTKTYCNITFTGGLLTSSNC